MNFERLGASVEPLEVTTLPSAPRDGQVIDYVASAAAGVIWRLRYRAASASAYKWEFVGGSALRSSVEAASTTTSVTYADLLDVVGPTVTAPLAGDYEVAWDCRVVPPQTINAICWVGPALGATAAADGNAVPVETPTADGVMVVMVGRTLRPTLAASDAVTLKYKTSSGTGSFNQRDLRITPVRVG
jgi:hypothetical protein